MHADCEARGKGVRSLRPGCLRAVRWGALLLLALSGTTSAAPVRAQTSQPPDLLRLTDEVLAQVSALRGLEVREPVGRELHSEASLRTYIAQRLREEYPGDKLEREQRLLAALELLPREFDLAMAVERLYASQTAGYYDPRKRILYLSESLPASYQMPTLAHELTHALQDQHFDIGEHMKPDRRRRDDDQQLALMGLLEGDATAVMLATLSGSAAADSWTESIPLFESDLLEALTKTSAGSAPPFLIELLNFPYRHGTPFVAKLYREGGWGAVSSAYERLPKSTEQILHPERYAPMEDAPIQVGRSVLPTRLEEHELYYDLVLGEFVTRLALEARAGSEDSVRAAEGWDGDRVALYAGARGDLLAWLSVWDAPDEATEFVRVLGRHEGAELVQVRGARVIFLRGVEALEEAYLVRAAGTLWKAWS